jgi:hypothetical protein
MQRVAGALFAKMREFEQGLTSMQLDVIIIRNVVDQMTVQVDTGLRLVDNDVNSMTSRLHLMTLQLDNNNNLMTNRFDLMTNAFHQVTLHLESMTRQLDQQSVSNQRWFTLIVGINLGMYLCMVYTAGALGYLSLRIPKHCNATNVTDGHYPETVMDRSDMRIIGEWFEWLVVRPWMN